MHLQSFIDLTHEISVTQGLANRQAIDVLDQAIKQANLRHSSQNSESSAQHFDAMVRAITPMIGERNDGSNLLGMTQVLGVNSLVTQAFNNARDKAYNPAPVEQIKTFLRDGAREYGKEAFSEMLAGAQRDLVISLVHTMHPTIYDTPEAQKFLTDLTEIFERCVASQSVDNRPVDGQPPHARPQAHVLSPEKVAGEMDGIRQLVTDFTTRLRDGKALLTPVKQVTVAQEAAAEERNIAAIRDEMTQVVAAWNQAVSETEMPASLLISPERANEIVQLRTWGDGADADGRPQASSLLLYQRMEAAAQACGAKDGKAYSGKTFDGRQNANEHAKFISALIQKKCSEGFRGEFDSQTPNPSNNLTFVEFCTRFMETLRLEEEARIRRNDPSDLPRYIDSNIALDPGQTILQELDPRDQAAFIRQIIQFDYKMIPPEYHKSVVDFTFGADGEQQGKYKTYRDAMMREHDAHIRAAGYDPDTITHREMYNVILPGDTVHGNLQNKFFDKMPETIGYALSDDKDGLGFQVAHNNRVRNYLAGRYKPAQDGSTARRSKSGRQEELSVEERTTLMDIGKRLLVFNEAIDRYGPKIADRHQIANFSSEVDFYNMLLLYKEAGLVTVEQDKVSETKMGIMPLVETIEDMRQAKQVFTNLLEDPMALSYFKTRGMAEIMLGFSDGAASGGNFASQWEIYNVARELNDLFAEKGIPLRIFQGRGRGTDRGGTVDPIALSDLMPPEVTRQGVVDMTIQSDLPSHWAQSRAAGEHYLTRLLIGTLGGTIAARTLSPETKEDRSKLEKAIQWIADTTATNFQRLVREHPNAMHFIRAMPENLERSSRPGSRPGEIPKWDKVRAITKESDANNADLPFHNAGLNGAMQQMAYMRAHMLEEDARPLRVEDREGNPLDGSKILRALNRHPFYRAIMKTIFAGINDFDRPVAQSMADMFGEYGGINANAKNFIEDNARDLDSLRAMIVEYSKLAPLPLAMPQLKDGEEPPAWAERTKKAPPPPQIIIGPDGKMSDNLDLVAHATMIAAGKAGKPMNPNPTFDPNWDLARRNLLCVTAAEIGNRELPSRMEMLGAQR